MVNAEWTDPRKNPLRRYIKHLGWTEDKAMNRLQEHGVISDNAISIDDVANYAKAMMWLHERAQEKLL